MKKILFILFAISFLKEIALAQKTFFQTGHTHDILEVHFSPDDAQLVSYSAGDGHLILWDVKSGRQIWVTETSFIRKTNESINLKEFYWSKDGKTLVTKSINDTFQTWDALTGRILAIAAARPETELNIPDKRQVNYRKDYNRISFPDPSNGATRVIESFGNNSAFDISYGGEMIAEGGSWGDAAIRITEIKTGNSWFLDGHPSLVEGIAFTPDGNFLAVGGSDKIIYIFNMKTHDVIERLVGHTNPVHSLAFSPDGRVLLSIDANETMKVWDWSEGKLSLDIKSDSGNFGVNRISFSADGKYFLTSSEDEEFRLWNAKTFALVRDYKTAEKYESSGGGITIGYDAIPVSSAHFSNDGQKIVSVHEDDSVRIWNVGDGKQIKKLKTCKDVTFAVFSKDDKKLLAYCKEREKEQIRLFDASTGRESHKFDADEAAFVETIAASPDGKVFATSDVGGTVFLWSFKESKPLRKFDIGFSGSDAIAFSPDGKTFAVGGRNQNLFVFDVETGEKLWQLIPLYQPGSLELELEELGKLGRTKAEVRKAERKKLSDVEVPLLISKITARFSHYGTAESFWNQKIVESGTPDKSKLILPKEGASAAWFMLTNDSDLPVAIDSNSIIVSPQCKGLCNGTEISLRYVMELKSRKIRVNGYDVFSKTILPPKTTVLFSIALKDFPASNSIYFEFTFQKDNPDDKFSNDYGPKQRLYLRETNLPK